MEALRATSVPSHSNIPKALRKSTSQKPKLMNLQSSPITRWSFSSTYNKNTSRPFKDFAISSPSTTVSTENTPPPPEPELETETEDEKFDWFSEWYPVMPVSDLDKRVPHGKKILGLDIVVWWDKNENAWEVFDDACPHRLAPLSDGRIDKWGRLQCAYHGWCFNGSGHCKLIPQATPDGPPVNTFKKACVGVYPSIVQHDMVWFWPNTDPEYKDIITKKKPPFIPELDNPSFSKVFLTRDIPCGYEILIENIMDPAHVPYSHYGIFQIDQPPAVKVDREGGKPLNISVNQLDINGFVGNHVWDDTKFVAPCVFYTCTNPIVFQSNGFAFSAATGKVKNVIFCVLELFKGLSEALFDNLLVMFPVICETQYSLENKSPEKRRMVVFFCIPVSPGNSRLIWGSAKNFGNWISNIIPQWMLHMGINLVVDSDLHLIHIEERKIVEACSANWLKTCFVPTKSDAFVVGFRRWLKKYSGGKIDWGGKFSTGTLPPTPPREQLMDRYWSHVVNCKSCHSAYKSLNALEVILQVISIVSVGIVAATRDSVIMSTTGRIAVVSSAAVCFAVSRWLARYIYKNFHYHDYNHALR
ncbi:hypothetical protein Ddye_025452 [Dipteronia dyeriana]|uniref:Rieske domain-containing protein n=1 Tax=Dipteronia dyeriana TaxID=168575 RepID=A0AAD9TK89_9ROSI|nr:hypothetical protein Ddye_025452 [Dipteronia dyeriana]